MRIFGEEELIAYHLGELSWWKQKVLRHQLKADAELAAASEEIAATLRAFSAGPEPAVSEALLERSWHRVRGSLGALDLPRRRRSAWIPVMASMSGVAVITVAIVAILHMHVVQAPPMPVDRGTPPRSVTTVALDAVAQDPALATHLNTTERVLTEVSHGDGPLRPEVREQVHRLLLENAVYRRSAEQYGDMGAAEIIDDLGRVLTTLDAEPVDTESDEGSRMEMNLSRVLFDLRILSHNESASRER